MVHELLRHAINVACLTIVQTQDDGTVRAGDKVAYSARKRQPDDSGVRLQVQRGNPGETWEDSAGPAVKRIDRRTVGSEGNGARQEILEIIRRSAVAGLAISGAAIT